MNTNSQFEHKCKDVIQKTARGRKCVWGRYNTPGSDHYIKEEWEQIIHAPQEVSIQHGLHLHRQLLKRLLYDHEFV